MPKPSDYTPARRYIMQAVMLLILAGMIALAAVVGASARRANRVELSPESISANDVTVRIPEGWRVRRDAKDPGVVVEAVEGAASEGADADENADARTVTVRTDRLPAPLSPLQYLFTQAEFPIGGPRGRQPPDDWLITIPMAGRSGVMMTAEHAPRRRGLPVRKQVTATVVMPSQRAVVVQLDGFGEADAHDHAVVRQVAAAITLANEPELGKPGEVITLAEGIRFNAPSKFAPVPETDANRTDRRLWPADPPRKEINELESRWLAIEAVGCLCPDFDANDPQQAERAKSTLATLLLARESLWRDATITSIGNKTWRADSPRNQDRGAAHPARAYLMTDASGRALLTILRSGIDHHDYDSVWREIARTVEFLPAGDIASLEDVGAAEASRLRSAGYEKLLADRDVEWWLWTRHDAYIGWSSTDFPGRGLAGRKETRIRLGGDDRVSRITHDFSYRDQGPQYSSTIARDLSDGGADVDTVQTTKLDGANLSMTFKEAKAEPRQLWTPDQPLPPQFVPGALLPLLLGQLSRDPMLLVTDSFPGREGIGPPQPLTLIIRPGDNTTRTAGGDATPLRCVSVQVNGAGSVSRWYFRKTGELESVDWPGGVQQIASDQNVVKNNFPKDDALAP